MTTEIKATVAPVGGLRQLLELPEGAPRLREDFTFIWWLRVRVTRDQQQLNGLVLT